MNLDGLAKEKLYACALESMARERTTLTDLGDILFKDYEDRSITVVGHVKMSETAFSKIGDELAAKIGNYDMLPDQIREVINKNYEDRSVAVKSPSRVPEPVTARIREEYCRRMFDSLLIDSFSKVVIDIGK